MARDKVEGKVPGDGKPFKKARSRLVLPPRVSPRETCVYVAGWAGIICYFTYSFYHASKEYRKTWEYKESHHFHKGWQIIPHKKDVSYGIYEQDRYIVLHHVLPWALGYLLAARVADIFIWKWKKWFYAAFGLISLYFIIGLWGVMILLGQCVVMFLTVKFARKRSYLWLLHLAFVAAMYYDPVATIWRSFFVERNLYVQFLILEYTYKFTCCRTLSFCLDTMDRQSQSFLDMVAYVFYFPVAIFGPNINYNTFEEQMCQPKQTWTVPRTMRSCWQLLRMAAWCLLMDFILHYLYIYAVHSDHDFLRTAPLWVLIGANSWQGLFFQMWHVCQFGVGRSIASLDQVETERTPRCVATVCYYGDMWRKFDRGMYSFIKRYIYQAAGGNRHGFPWQLICSFFCFLYIAHLQGGGGHLYAWVIINFLESTFEIVLSKIYRSQPAQIWLRQRLSEANLRRLQALFTVPLHVFSLVFIHVFFDSFEVAWIYADRFYMHGNLFYYMFTVVGMYFYVQSCLEADIWEAYIEGKISSIWYNDIDEVDIRVLQQKHLEGKKEKEKETGPTPDTEEKKEK